ncbi:MAG: hypothetical protein GY952_13125 [Rhodobacteraceae bacterium]|nr:hypothetical protein [Paracoccaceae bacterium]
MTLAERLDELRLKQPGCQLVAFGDLGTRLILRTSSQTPFPQENLDQLCMLAAQTFSLCDKVQGEGGVGNDAIIHTPNETTVIVRSQTSGDDFLCCLCESDENAREFAKSAAIMLNEISQVHRCSE